MTAEIRRVTKHDPIIKCMTARFSPSEAETWRVLSQSELWVGLWNGELKLVWGLIPDSLLSDRAYIWLFGSAVGCRKTFLKLVKQNIADYLKLYSELWGHCEHNTTLLNHLGAKILGADFIIGAS